MKQRIKANLFRMVKITNIKTGEVDYKRVNISNKVARDFIMKVNNLDKVSYRKRYDIFKNKLYRYYSVKNVDTSERQSPLELLYLQAKSKQRMKEQYTPSRKMRMIETMVASSYTKTRKDIANKSKSYQNSVKEITDNYELALAIYFSENPTVEQAYFDYKEKYGELEAMNKLNEWLESRKEKHKQDKEGNVIPNQTFSEGETSGTDTYSDSDVEDFFS